MTQNTTELEVERLWNPCDPELFAFETTESLPERVSIIGQERAVRAIDFGVGIASFGFNIYALGFAGTGRTTTLRTFLENIAADQPVPEDWVYVHRFTDPNQPRAISLPPGKAAELRTDMQELVSDLEREIPRAFASEDYERQREQIVREMQEQRNTELSQLEQRVSEQGFTLMKTPVGLGIAPVLNGQVLSPEAYQQLDEATRKDIESRQGELQGTMGATMRSLRDLEKDTKRRLQDYDREIADFAVAHLIQDLQEKYAELDEVPEYLAAVRSDIVDNVQGFREDEPAAEGLGAAMRAGERVSLLKRYQVNVIVDHGSQEGAPVVYEPNPSFGNLIGRIEHRAEFGALVTDFTMIKAGALHRANGGYLMVEMRPLLTNPFAWEALKRALKNLCIRSEEMTTQLQVVSTVTLEPEPIPLDVKVVIIGDPLTYYLLQGYDEDFGKLFKVQADFGSDFDRTDETCRSYARFVAARCHQEGLAHFDAEAVSRVVEHGSRLAEHQEKLSTRFGEVADLVREASYWARRDNRELASATDVQKAVDEQIYRASRAEDRIRELIDDGVMYVDVEGQTVGQVNGLSVLALGNYSFGKPSRITVRTYTGKSGVVSLDREAKLSGRIYDKGLLTITGYLGGKYALASPLSLSATISFEQLYEEIEGDSASSTELYALLSSLSGLAIKQGLAVTGSIDQQGRVQPIGGANEKIEGFFDVCRRRGLTGEQGVLLPAQNVVNLMLHGDVREAVEAGQFHIYPVETIDEGLEILTGVPAGQLQEDGSYPDDSVHGLVMARLEEIASNLKRKDKDEGEDEDNPEGSAAAQVAPTDGCAEE
jgi:lon-related putative ATP-dependent protease